MKKYNFVCDGNEAASNIAYRLSDMAVIYPITPSSSMAENFEMWSSKGIKNIFGNVPECQIMQSEAGAIGAVHGALQMGSHTTTFTASQGLLLMIPNMYKIAGEGHPFVMHVAARAIASQGLSIFGDHSDVYAARETGFCMLASNSVQEAHDMALVSHIATLRAKLPFMHFFDGFRTSHEINNIEKISDEVINKLLTADLLKAKSDMAMSNENPVIRGTAQNPDVFMQGRESVNLEYAKVPLIVSQAMNDLGNLTGRAYDICEYVGHENPENIIVCMGSSAAIVEEYVENQVEAGHKIGLIKVRLYRPFPAEKFISVLPKSVKKIAVLDRTKEPGSVGEPLFLDAVSVLKRAGIKDVEVIGGRYGMGSKEFNDKMVASIFAELKKEKSKPEFVVGIKDDLTNLSLDEVPVDTKDDSYGALFFGLGADGTVGASKNSADIINENSPKFIQNYSVYDSKKSGGFTCSHLRVKDNQIKSSYLVGEADFISVSHFPMFYKQEIVEHAKKGAILLINSPYEADVLWEKLPIEVCKQIREKEMSVYTIDAGRLARDLGLGFRINTIMQTCFFKLSGVINFDVVYDYLKKSIEKSYSKKGQAIVDMNMAAVEKAVDNMYKFIVPEKDGDNHIKMSDNFKPDTPDFIKEVIGAMINGKGDELPTSAFTNKGEFPVGTTKFEKRSIASQVPAWNKDVCIQCGKCALSCPHAAIRTNVLTNEQVKNAPENFEYAKYKTPELGEGLNYCVTIAPHDCTGCQLCVVNCPIKNQETPALKMVDKQDKIEEKIAAFEYVYELPEFTSEKLNLGMAKHNQLKKPLFEFSGSCAGCGQTPYVKLLTQLFGDKMVVANATGCSSIYGGNLPTTPWTKNDKGHGPVWSNSLFEDNAEYGFGMRLALDNQGKSGKSLWIIGGDGWAYDIGYGGLDHVLYQNRNVNILVLDTEVYSNTGGQASKSTPMGASAKFATSGKQMPKKDLAMIAMASNNAYVGRIALGANEAQAIRTLREAESYDGPSIVIAYAPCVLQGIDMKFQFEQQKLAVKSGHFPLYRFDPRLIGTEKNPFQLDSDLDNNIPLKDYVKNENRYEIVKRLNEEKFDSLIEEAERLIKLRNIELKKLAE